MTSLDQPLVFSPVCLSVCGPGERRRRGEGGTPAGRVSDPSGRKSAADEGRLCFQKIRIQPDQEERFTSLSLIHRLHVVFRDNSCFKFYHDLT